MMAKPYSLRPEEWLGLAWPTVPNPAPVAIYHTGVLIEGRQLENEVVYQPAPDGSAQKIWASRSKRHRPIRRGVVHWHSRKLSGSYYLTEFDAWAAGWWDQAAVASHTLRHKAIAAQEALSRLQQQRERNRNEP